jgi:flagellar export protein FliJ
MATPARLARLCRLRTHLREQAATELRRRVARVGAIERELGDVRDAEDEARRRASRGGESGAAVVLAWAFADGLARRASALLDDRARAITSAEGARETVRERRRAEEQLARLAARVAARADDAAAREHDRTVDELALWAHGRTS